MQQRKVDPFYKNDCWLVLIITVYLLTLIPITYVIYINFNFLEQ